MKRAHRAGHALLWLALAPAACALALWLVLGAGP